VRRIMLLCMALFAVPLLLAAQAPRKPASGAAPRKTVEVAKTEFGADVAAFFQHVSAEGGTLNHVVAAGPIEVRVGFPLGEYATVEPRVSFAYDSKGAGGETGYTLGPDINVTYGVLGGENASGYYATAGAGLVVTHTQGTASQAQLNVGFGRRAGILRIEGFVQDVLRSKSNHLPNRLNVGVRVGVSVWS
jgi:hypothetical protein